MIARVKPAPAGAARLRRWMLAVMLAAVVAAPGAMAQSFTPPPGSPLRTEILDVVRQMVEAEAGKPVEFVVSTLNVLGEWAFVIATPQRPGGGEIAWTHTRYQEARDVGAFSGQAIALLRNTPAGWLVYAYDLGASDAVWYDWQGYIPAPPEVYELN